MEREARKKIAHRLVEASDLVAKCWRTEAMSRGDKIAELRSEITRLNEEVERLRAAGIDLASAAGTVRKVNQPEWMHFIGHALNDFARAVDSEQRFKLRHQGGDFWFELDQPLRNKDQQ